MLDFLFEALLSIIWEVIIEVLGELLLELFVQGVTSTLAEGFRPKQHASPFLAAVGLIGAGALIGVGTSIILPHRIFGFQTTRGFSLVLAPLVTGYVMEMYGNWCDKHSRRRSGLATFPGGAVFAFSVAVVRFYLVGTH
jgi:hypothetical protein